MINHVKTPVSIPVPGNKQIEEYEGRVSTGMERYSVAHMIAPPGWGEPWQTPQFDEITIVIRGELLFETPDGNIQAGAGETVRVDAGTPIRYSNPFLTDAEYWAVCVPAFSPETVNRTSGSTD